MATTIKKPRANVKPHAKSYTIVMQVYSEPKHIRALRDSLDELCDTCVEEGGFTVYDSHGKPVKYGQE